MRTVAYWVIAASLSLLTLGCEQPTAEKWDDGQDKSAPTKTDTMPAAPVHFESCMSGLPEEGMWKCDPVFVDVNGDGHADLAAIPRLGKGPRVWLGDGRGNWRDSSNGLEPGIQSCGGGVDVGDVNEDGHLDLVAADHCQGVYVYFGNGAGGWTMVTQALWPAGAGPNDPAGTDLDAKLARGAEDVAIGDVNGDGHLDLVAAGSDKGGLNVYLGDGSGSNWQHSPSALPDHGWSNRVALYDINNDGHLDVTATFAEGPRVWINDGAGNWTSASVGLPSPIVHGLYIGLGSGDLNGDGLPDLAVANWVDGPEVYFQQKGGTWVKSDPAFPDMNGGALGLAVGDVDGDGALDLVVSGRLEQEGGFVRGVYLLLGDGAGGFGYVADSGLPPTGLSATAGVGVGDINADGILDIAAGSGLIVESVPGQTEPVIPTRLPVWCGHKTGAE